MFLSPEVIESDITESLERLGMDVIDLYYLHRDDTRVPVDEIMETLNAEVQKGRIRYLGASNWSVQRIASANAYAKGRGLEPFCCSQVQWSLAEPTWTIDQDPTLRYITQVEATWHQTTGLPVVSYTSTAGGYFAGRGQDEGDFATEENAQRLARAEKLARKKNCTPTQIALAYLINHDFPVYPCFGTTNPDHLEEILGAEPIELDDGEIRYLREG
jgi:aryl-alcohol dehydrogenase-like predicted oxidoreductase